MTPDKMGRWMDGWRKKRANVNTNHHQLNRGECKESRQRTDSGHVMTLKCIVEAWMELQQKKDSSLAQP